MFRPVVSAGRRVRRADEPTPVQVPALPSTTTSPTQVDFHALGRSFHFSLVPRGPALTSSSVVVIRGENSTEVVAPPAQDSCLYWGESPGPAGQERVALNFCGGFVSYHTSP